MSQRDRGNHSMEMDLWLDRQRWDTLEQSHILQDRQEEELVRCTQVRDQTSHVEELSQIDS